MEILAIKCFWFKWFKLPRSSVQDVQGLFRDVADFFIVEFAKKTFNRSTLSVFIFSGSVP